MAMGRGWALFCVILVIALPLSAWHRSRMTSVEVWRSDGVTVSVALAWGERIIWLGSVVAT